MGLLAMAHVVAALGGVDWVDLDTAFLLAATPSRAAGPSPGPHVCELTGEPGLGVAVRLIARRPRFLIQTSQSPAAPATGRPR